MSTPTSTEELIKLAVTELASKRPDRFRVLLPRLISTLPLVTKPDPEAVAKEPAEFFDYNITACNMLFNEERVVPGTTFVTCIYKIMNYVETLLALGTATATELARLGNEKTRELAEALKALHATLMDKYLDMLVEFIVREDEEKGVANAIEFIRIVKKYGFQPLNPRSPGREAARKALEAARRA